MNAMEARIITDGARKQEKTFDYKVFEDEELNAVILSIEKDIVKCANMGKNYSAAKLTNKDRKMKDLTLAIIMQAVRRHFLSRGFHYEFDGLNLMITW